MECVVGIGDPATHIPHPEELATQIQIAMAGVFADRQEEVTASLLGCVFDFRAWLDAEGVHLHNCFMSREGVDAVHSFNYKRHEDLTGQEAAQVRQQPRFHAPHNEDVFCATKRWMHFRHGCCTRLGIAERAIRQVGHPGAYKPEGEER